MKILFPYLARWHSANRSRYHQLLTHIARLGHDVHVLKAPPMALDDISSRDVGSTSTTEPASLHINELQTSPWLRSFWATSIPGTKGVKKGMLSLTSADEIRRYVDRTGIDVLLLYNLTQTVLLDVQCHCHFDLADDLTAMMRLEHPLLSRIGGASAARSAQDRLLNRSDSVTTASRVLSSQIGCPHMLLPNGADLDELDRVDGSAWRSRGAGPTVGFVGAFEYWVDFDLVLDVAARLPRVTFLLVGGGRRWRDIGESIGTRGLTNIHLTGPAAYREAMSYVAGMDVCLLPFTRDAVSDGSCPLKLFEYAALRKPVVSTRTREVEEIGQGWIAFADDASSASAAIEHFLTNPAAASEASEMGRRVVESNYNWKALSVQFIDYLTKQLKRG